MVFVTLAIVFLFAHRAVTLTTDGGDAELLAKKKRTRLLVAILAIVSFAVMVTFFLINMRVNR